MGDAHMGAALSRLISPDQLLPWYNTPNKEPEAPYRMRSLITLALCLLAMPASPTAEQTTHAVSTSETLVIGTVPLALGMEQESVLEQLKHAGYMLTENESSYTVMNKSVV